jgi:hypothetical protein
MTYFLFIGQIAFDYVLIAGVDCDCSDHFHMLISGFCSCTPFLQAHSLEELSPSNLSYPDLLFITRIAKHP